MPHYHFYDPTTGQFTSRQYSGPEELVALNTPEGLQPLEGVYDHLAQCVNLKTLEVVDYQSPPPPDTEYMTYAWDAETKRWKSTPTELSIGLAVRADRDLRLTKCDWVVARAYERGTEVPAEWLTYRQALRDVTTQRGFPHVIVWPAIPGSEI